MGYCLHANGFQFPLHIPGDYTTKSPAELWDQVPSLCGNQILGAPRHRRDVLSVAASARWSGDSTPSTRHLFAHPTHWLICTQVPTNGKLQILGFVAFLEFFGELGGRVGAPAHYMRGGLPGAYPSFKKYLNGVFPHPVPLDLYDPFGIFSNASPEKKARGRLIEINNGRLAMIGLFGFLSESKVPGSVPALGSIVLPYDGDYMAPLEPLHFLN